MKRFDYVKFDEETAKIQADIKSQFEALERTVDATLPNGRAKSLVMTKLEEAYMWVGKANRDVQVAKGSAQLQEERCNS